VSGPQVGRLADLLTEGGAQVRRESGTRISVSGASRTEIGELAYRHGVLLHELTDHVVTRPGPIPSSPANPLSPPPPAPAPPPSPPRSAAAAPLVAATTATASAATASAGRRAVVGAAGETVVVLTPGTAVTASVAARPGNPDQPVGGDA